EHRQGRAVDPGGASGSRTLVGALAPTRVRGRGGPVPRKRRRDVVQSGCGGYWPGAEADVRFTAEKRTRVSTNPPGLTPCLWRRCLRIPLIWTLAVALVAGVVAGLVISAVGAQSWAVPVLDLLGQLFLNLLQMLIFPLIITTLIAGVTSTSPQ